MSFILEHNPPSAFEKGNSAFCMTTKQRLGCQANNSEALQSSCLDVLSSSSSYLAESHKRQTHLTSQGSSYDPHVIYRKTGIPLKCSESLPTSLICTSRCPVQIAEIEFPELP